MLFTTSFMAGGFQNAYEGLIWFADAESIFAFAVQAGRVFVSFSFPNVLFLSTAWDVLSSLRL